MRRRGLVRALPVGLAALAGCGGRPDLLGGGGDESTPGPASTPASGGSGGASGSAGAGDDRPAPGVVVDHGGDAPLFATVVVETADGSTLLSESRRYAPGDRATYPGVAREAGTYRVLVVRQRGTGAERRFETDWEVRGALSDLVVTLRAGAVDVHQRAACTPRCPPLSASGEGVPLPWTGPDSSSRPGGNGRADPGRLVVANRTGATRDVSVRVDDGDDRTLVDYRYRVPPALRPVLPVTTRAGRYDVTVGTGAAERRYDWQLPAEATLTAIVDPGPSVLVRCGRRSRDLRLRNETDATRTVAVAVVDHSRSEPVVPERDAGDGPGSATATTTATATETGTRTGTETESTTPADDGGSGRAGDVGVVFRDSFELAAGAWARRPAVVPEAGDYRLSVRTDTGAAATYDWAVCPPRGAVYVIVDDDEVRTGMVAPI